MPVLSRIIIYPIKSLDAVEVARATVLASGAIEHDRRFAICDRQGQIVNGKRTSRVHQLRLSVDLDTRAMQLRIDGDDTGNEFHMDRDRSGVEEWLSAFFGFSVQIVEDRAAGFPDDTLSPGPTVISTATLEAVASWFGGLSSQEVRRRFRANLEIDGVEPFWEDRLYAETGRYVRFQIGSAGFLGTNPCQRCVVPTRSPATGQPIAGFAKTFALRREETLPPWAARSRFDHYYRLAVNTIVTEPGELCVGDEVRLIDAP